MATLILPGRDTFFADGQPLGDLSTGWIQAKQGSRLVRWAAVEAVAKGRTTSAVREAQRSISARRGTHIARVAAARKILTLVYYGMRDGEIRCLAQRA